MKDTVMVRMSQTLVGLGGLLVVLSGAALHREKKAGNSTAFPKARLAVYCSLFALYLADLFREKKKAKQQLDEAI